jgi:biopolymer transport protein ExbD
MLRRRRRERCGRGRVAETPDLLPLMNVFIAIIPMLLITAVFLEVQAIRMQPAGPSQPVATEAPVVIAVLLDADGWRVERGGVAVGHIRHAEDPDGSRLVALLRDTAAGRGDRREVQVLARPETSYESVIRAMDLARAAGLSEASLGEHPQGAGS